MRAPAPTPCVTYHPTADGTMAVASIETRDPVRIASGWEADSVRYHFNVTCLQETGEDQFVGRARSRAHAETVIDAHTLAHPEHHSYRVTSI